jgi:hypothetical protein
MAVLVFDRTTGKLVEKSPEPARELEIHTLGNGPKARAFRRVARASNGSGRRSKGERKRARYPITCALNGVTKPQVEEAREAAKKAGLSGVDYAPNGNVIWADSRARKAYLREMKLRDNSGYY